MESYVIRIYRLLEPKSNCAGQAEIIETDEKKAFRNLDELLEILQSRWMRSSEKKKHTTIKS